MDNQLIGNLVNANKRIRRDEWISVTGKGGRDVGAEFRRFPLHKN